MTDLFSGLCLEQSICVLTCQKFIEFSLKYLCFGMPEDYDTRLQAMKTLCYPLEMTDRIPEITEARNIELGLSLQLAFMHPSKYKFEHPRFCYERLEYLGQKIQDLVMAERLLIKHLDAPGRWLMERHRRILMNKFCWKFLREKFLHHFIIYSEEVEDAYENNRRLRNPATTSDQQAIHHV